MISIDHTLLLQMFQFLVILFLGKKLIFDPVSSNVHSRNSKIQSLLKDAEALRNEVASLKKEYEEKLNAVKAEVADYQKKIREEAIAIASEKVNKAKAEIDKRISDARVEIGLQLERSKATLASESNEIADLIINKILGNAS
ncbi:MAG: ATP synthase F0 subunit B [Calditerrivibrio sp.]|nr:ATP synthase F0 subunit B [Calditerrivibrio sp.]